MKGKIYSAILGSCIALSPLDAAAQGSLDPAVKIGSLEEKAVLDDSADTWKKTLHVVDEGKPGDPVSVGLIKNNFAVSSRKAGKFNRDYNRSDLQYCIIDRDPTPDKTPECSRFPARGNINVPEWATNGYFTLFLEVPGSRVNEVARVDEYFRLPKPTGKRSFTRTVPAGEAPAPAAGREERATPAGGRRFDERPAERAEPARGRIAVGREAARDESERTPESRRVTVSGSFGTDESLETAAESDEAIPASIPREGINLSTRLRTSPNNSLNTVAADNADGSQSISLDNAVEAEAVLGYDVKDGSVGVFGSAERIRKESLRLNDYWFGVAARVDTNHGRRRELHISGNVGPYFHRVEHSVGDDYTLEMRNRRVAAALYLSLEMPRIILNRNGFSAGFFNELFARQLTDLLVSNGNENSINYGAQTTFVNRVGPKFGFRAGRLSVDLSGGWEYTLLPTIRPNTNRIPEEPFSQQPLVDYQRIDPDTKRGPFSGHQLVASLDLRAGDLMAGIFYSSPVSGTIERNFAGVYIGYWNNLKLGYEFSSDSVETAGERRRENVSHSGVLQLGTDFDRLLLPNSAMAPSQLLR